MNNLALYKNSVTSQYGEDGIIEEILNRIGTKNKICVKFGAGPGKDLSNTWILISREGWKGILIESQDNLVRKWKRETQNYSVTILNQFVEISGGNSLDNILDREGVPLDIDLASIDIDGNDYHIFNGIKKYRPRIVVIEYNSTIPPHIEMVQDPEEKDSYGASAKSLVKLAHEKGYKLAAATVTDCIFVTEEEFGKLEVNEPKIEEIFDTSNLTYLMSTYGGSNFLLSNHYPPSYSCFYDIHNLNLTKKIFHSVSIGISMNRNYSEKLSKETIPVKIFINRNERRYGIIGFILITIKKIFPVMRKLLKKVVPRSLVKKVRETNTLVRWYLDGQPNPAPDPVKQKIVAKYGKKSNLRTFVETGTAGGLMIKAIGKNFDKIMSIELDDLLFSNAQENFADNKNITILHGDSGEKLAEILPQISEPALFWLDAHYSGEGTARGESETPVIKELLTIFSRKNKKDTILIDDARCFDGTHDYPTVEQVRNLVANYDYLSFKTERDIMVIEPSK